MYLKIGNGNHRMALERFSAVNADGWVEWKRVTYKGCLEHELAPTDPSQLQTECYRCYAQRLGLSHSDAIAMYKSLVPTKRGDRVKPYHEAMRCRQLASSSSTDSGAAAGSSRKQKRKAEKRFFDEWVAERGRYDPAAQIAET